MPNNNIDELLALKRERHQRLDRMHELVQSAQSHKRDLSRREQGEFDKLAVEIDKVKSRIEKLGSAEFDPRLVQDTGGGREASPASDMLTREQRMVDWVSDRFGGSPDEFERGGFSVGRVLTALVRRDRSNLTDHEQRALLEGTDAAGGFLLPTPLAAQLIDRLRNQARVFQAGATTVPMVTPELNLARLAGGTSLAWKDEGQPVQEGSMTFERVPLKAKTLPLIVKISQELFSDLSEEASQLIEDEMTKALALELDRVILRGSGVDPEPRGIRNQAGVTITSLGADGGNVVGYDDIATAIGRIRSANAEPNAALFSARTASEYDRLKNAIGDPMTPPTSVRNLTLLPTNQIPDNLVAGNSGPVCTEIYTGEWRHVLVGMRADGLQIGIRPLMERYADSLMVGLLLYARMDVALAHPEAFDVVVDIKAIV